MYLLICHCLNFLNFYDIVSSIFVGYCYQFFFINCPQNCFFVYNRIQCSNCFLILERIYFFKKVSVIFMELKFFQFPHCFFTLISFLDANLTCLFISIDFLSLKLSFDAQSMFCTYIYYLNWFSIFSFLSLKFYPVFQTSREPQHFIFRL